MQKPKKDLKLHPAPKIVHRVKHLVPTTLLLGSLAGFFPAAFAAFVVVLDNFEAYSSPSYVQDQGRELRRRFDTATTDGIYGGPRGAQDRASGYMVNWSLGNAGYLRYTFPPLKRFPLGIEFTLERQVGGDDSEPLVRMVVADGDSNAQGHQDYHSKLAITPPIVARSSTTTSAEPLEARPWTT